MKQASRLWVKKYTRPRDDKGRFLPGWELWERVKAWGGSRWVRSFAPGPWKPLRYVRIDEDGLRHLKVMVFLIVVAALLAIFVR